MVGPRRARRELVAESHDLVDASEAYAAAGYDAEEAAILAVADFGRVDEVAPAFQATLAVAASPRTAWLPFGAMAIQPFLSDDGINLTGSTADVDGRVYAVLDQGIEILGTLVMAGAFAALLVTGSATAGVLRAAAQLTGHPDSRHGYTSEEVSLGIPPPSVGALVALARSARRCQE